MTQQIFAISDLHLGHENIIEYCRPEFADLDDMHNYLIKQWNSVVRPQDKVYVLGDVVFKKTYIEILAELHGTKNLIMGNHDNSVKLYKFQEYFKKIRGCHQLYEEGFGNMILTHIPVHPGQLDKRFKLNIHGHLHTNVLDDPRYINVSCEQVDFKPKLVQDIVKEYREKYDPILDI